MPLRSDPSIWHSMPGVVAALQPVAAPGPLMANYNMARGQSGFLAHSAPWSVSSGWNIAGNGMYAINTGVFATAETSVLVRFSGNALSGNQLLYGTIAGSDVLRVGSILGGYTAALDYGSTGITWLSSPLVSGVMGNSGGQAYINGLPDGSPATWSGSSIGPLYLGAQYVSGLIQYPMAGNIQCALFAQRYLTPAEMWLAAQQMAYCHVNPAWSVWSPSRRWFFISPPVPAAATPVLSTIYINSADIGDTSLFDSVSGAAVSSTYARTGTNSFELGGSDYLQADLTSSATKYSKFGLLVTATPGADALLCAWQEDGTEHVSLYLTDKLTLQMRQGSTIIQTSPTTLETATWYCVETKVVVHTATGRFQVRIDGVDDMSAIGINTDADVDGAINEIRFESPVDDTYIDDIVVREDQWCGTGGVNVIVPTAAGTVEEWTGDYADVDDLPPSFTDYIDVTTESGSDQTFRHGGLSGGYDVDVVGVFAKGKLDAESAEIQFYALVRSALVDNVGYAQTLDTIGVYARLLMTTDPNGTVAWTTHTVNNALQIGVRA